VKTVKFELCEDSLFGYRNQSVVFVERVVRMLVIEVV
jgi:hypothetical protein